LLLPLLPLLLSMAQPAATCPAAVAGTIAAVAISARHAAVGVGSRVITVGLVPRPASRASAAAATAAATRV
jgi:hypothetical protein